MQDLKKSWQIIDNFEYVVERFEPDIDFAQITSQSESVLLITFEIFIGEQSYLMNLCFATFAFDTVLAKLTSQNFSTIRPVKYQGGTSAKSIIMSHLNKTKLEVTVNFGKAQISFNELMNLKKDDIVIIDKRVGDLAEIKIDKRHLFNGRIGNVNNHKAVKITNKVEKEL
jgi:flagellar motor switch protein FliM